MVFAAGSIEDNVKKLQRRDLTRRDRLATKMVISEQRVLQGTVDALRRCLLRLLQTLASTPKCS